jgi:ADP-heptose:LPS heptosyltransferase
MMRVYCGILGQIGDIIAFTPTARSIKERLLGCELTFAVSRRYREAGELIAGLPYVDNLFVTENYFDRLIPELAPRWEAGWPVDLRGDDEVEEQRNAIHPPTLP